MNLMRLNSIISEGIESAGVFNYTSAEDLTESYNEFQLNLLAEQQASDNIYEFFNGSLLESSSLCTFEVEILQENFIKNAFNKIIEFFTKIINWIKEMAKKFVDFIKGLFNKNKEAAKESQETESKVKKHKENLETIKKEEPDRWEEIKKKKLVIECHEWMIEKPLDPKDIVIINKGLTEIEMINNNEINKLMKEVSSKTYGVTDGTNHSRPIRVQNLKEVTFKTKDPFADMILNCKSINEYPKFFKDFKSQLLDIFKEDEDKVIDNIKKVVKVNDNSLTTPSDVIDKYISNLKGKKIKYVDTSENLVKLIESNKKSFDYNSIKSAINELESSVKINLEVIDIFYESAKKNIEQASKSTLEDREGVISIINGMKNIFVKYSSVFGLVVSKLATMLSDYSKESKYILDQKDKIQVAPITEYMTDKKSVKSEKDDINPETGNKYKPYTPDLTKSQEERLKEQDEFMADPDARLTFK